MVIVTGIFTINDVSKRDEILSAMARLNEVNQSMEGYIIHDWYTNLWDPNQIRLYIEYESPETLQGIEQNPAFNEAKTSFYAHVESGAMTLQMESHRRHELVH